MCYTLPDKNQLLLLKSVMEVACGPQLTVGGASNDKCCKSMGDWKCQISETKRGNWITYIFVKECIQLCHLQTICFGGRCRDVVAFW